MRGSSSGQMKTDWWWLSENVHNTRLSGKDSVCGWQENVGSRCSHPINTGVISEVAGAPEVIRIIIKSQRKVVYFLSKWN